MRKGRSMWGSERSGTRRAMTLAVAVGVMLLAGSGARADIASDKAAAIVIFPKLLVDTSATPDMPGLDTFIRLTNTSDEGINVQCFYVNATPICSIPGASCFPDRLACFSGEGAERVFGTCKAQWQETDFFIHLTPYQPTGWLVSQGSDSCLSIDINGRGVCSHNGAMCTNNVDCGGGNRCVLPPCFPLDGIVRKGPDGESNADGGGSRVPNSPEDPFIGELKCVALDESLQPIDRNVLKGEAIIGIAQLGPRLPFIDVAGYNAIGIPAIPDAGNRDNVLVLGGTSTGEDPEDPCHEAGNCAEYEGCPNFLILNHYYDGAVDPLVPNVCRGGSCTVAGSSCAVDADCENVCNNGFCNITGEQCDNDEDCNLLIGRVRVATDLTLIPCTQDFENQDPGRSRTIAQFLLYNEFEQRFSTSITVDCFKETRLSDLDTSQNDRSLWSAGVGGTLTGQTRIRGVVPRPLPGETPSLQTTGNALLGIAEEFRCQGPDFPTCSFTSPTGLFSSTAANVHFQGRRPESDFLILP